MKIFHFTMTIFYLFPIFTSTEQQYRLDFDGKKFYDAFDDETSLAYEGGHVIVECSRKSPQCPQNGQLELVHVASKKIVDSVTCVQSVPEYSLRLNINDAMELGKYQCQLKNHTPVDVLDINYRLCSDNGPDCKNEKKCPNSEKFCVVTGSGKPTTCGKVEKAQCQLHPRQVDVAFCPSGGNSLCEAISEDYSNAFAKMAVAVCPNDPLEVPRIQYLTNDDRRYNEPIEINPTNKGISVSVPDDGNSYGSMACVIKNRARTSIQNYASPPGMRIEGKDVEYFQLVDALFNNGSQIFKLFCTISRITTAEAWLSNFLVYIQEGNVTIVPILDSNNRYSTHAKCELKPLPSSNDFSVVYGWPGLESKIDAIQIFESRIYQCNVTTMYKSCGPHREFSRTIASGNQMLEVNPAHTTPSTLRSITARPDNGTGVVASTAKKILKF